jgi:hypothetical protein
VPESDQQPQRFLEEVDRRGQVAPQPLRLGEIGKRRGDAGFAPQLSEKVVSFTVHPGSQIMILDVSGGISEGGE